MAFLTPFFLLLGLLALPIIIMYMLRLRRREVMVSSTLLWQKLMRDREANAPWQKLRRNILLILQLLILAALVLALARPFIPVPSVVSGSVVVLLDGSASMQATDVAPSRFEAARTQVDDLIGALGGGDQMTLIRVGQTPVILAAATGDRRILRDALAAAQPDNGAANWAAAVALASGAAQGFRDARIVVVSDGGLPEDLPPLSAEVVYLPVGSSGENLAITALATRETESGPQLFASVTNHGRLPHTTLLSIALDGRLFDSRRIEIAAGATTAVTWDLPEGTVTIEAHLSDHEEDHLALDDRAWAVHEGGVTNRALIVTAGNIFLEQVYTVLPGIEAFKAAPDADLAAAAEEGFDLYIFDSVSLPDPVPPGNLLIINPPPAETEGGLLRVSGTFTQPVVTRLQDDPLLQFVDWGTINIRQARQVSAPWARPIVSAAEGPLLLIGERAGYRIAIIPFALQDSDLPLQIAFPILMANITHWLSPGRAFDAPTGLQAGETINIQAGAGTTAVRITKPDGTTWAAEVGEEELFFTETDLLGLYELNLSDPSGRRPAGRFAVNLFAPNESNIRPGDTIPLGQGADSEGSGEDIGQRELWPWLAALALLVLVVEWWLYHRGVPILRRPVP